MSEKKMVKFKVVMGENEAWQLAQFLKRTTWEDIKRKTETKENAEIYLMRDGIDAVQVALEDVGINPR